MPRRFLVLLPLIGLGCGGQELAPPPSEPEPTPAVVHRNPKIPTEVSYPIIEDNEDHGPLSKKRVIKVRLNMRVSLEVLREIALDVKATETKQYERTFIFHYLPKLVHDAPESPWAITHFNPTLSVQILGLTKEQNEELRVLPLTEYGEIIGAWLIDDQFVSRLCVLHQTVSGVKLTDHTPGGGEFTSDVVELPSEKGRQFKKTNGGDIYAVDDSGVLRLYDGREGYLASIGEPLR